MLLVTLQRGQTHTVSKVGQISFWPKNKNCSFYKWALIQFSAFNKIIKCNFDWSIDEYIFFVQIYFPFAHSLFSTIVYWICSNLIFLIQLFSIFYCSRERLAEQQRGRQVGRLRCGWSADEHDEQEEHLRRNSLLDGARSHQAVRVRCQSWYLVIR